MIIKSSSNYTRLKHILIIFTAELGDPNDQKYKTLVCMQSGQNLMPWQDLCIITTAAMSRVDICIGQYTI